VSRCLSPVICATHRGSAPPISTSSKGFTEDFQRKLCIGSLGAVLDTPAYLKNETSRAISRGG